MKNRRILLALLTLVLIVGMMGCGGSSSSGGGTTTPTPPATQTPFQKLVGTWTMTATSDYWLGPLIVNADGTGSWNGTGFTNASVSNGVFNFTEPAGNVEAFDIAWSSDNNTITLINHNGGSTYTYTRASASSSAKLRK
jgi:hypothetical protein